MPSCCSHTDSCTEKFGDAVEGTIGGAYGRLGNFVGARPRLTIILCLLLTGVCGFGLTRFTPESRPEELWVPQGTTAEEETELYESYFPTTSRFNTMIVEAASGGNILTQESLQAAIRMHAEIETSQATVDDQMYDLIDLCTKSGGSCVNPTAGAVCQCLVTSILKQWNYNLETLQNDDDFFTTLTQYGSREDIEAVLGGSVWNENDELVSAEALSLSYFLIDRAEVVNGEEQDPINEGWEKDVFLDVAGNVPERHPELTVAYFSTRSFSDEFGDAIGGDIILVNVSYIVIFLFIGATMGKVRCGTGSRWTMAFAALVMVGTATIAGFGISSLIGLIFSPVHNLLPFVLLGIGVDDGFVLVNAFNRERNVPRSQETNKELVSRTGRALARAGSSILVTSLTDIVAFAISATSALPALASFGAFAAISIFFLWSYASTFFAACLVADERRQRDNRREILCCIKRQGEVEDEAYEEGYMSKFFRNYHAPAIFSVPGKVAVILSFAGLFAFGIFGTMELSVEDSTRSFIPDGSYLQNYFDKADEYFPDQGIDLYITFEGSSEIYADRDPLSELDSRLTGLSTAPPYISEPVSEEAYRNVMDGFAQYLTASGTGDIGGAPLGEDGWPTSEADFVSTLALYANTTGPGSRYAQDVSFSEDVTELRAFFVRLEYIKLVRIEDGEVKDDAFKQIDAMDATRAMVESWDDLPPAFPYSDAFLAIEGFKVIRRELFQNIGLAIACVGIIVLFTVASPMAALLITFNVGCCLVEILGFLWALGIVIDSVSVINLVLAVGLSVDYSAHVGHCFMTKGGTDKNKRATEALADIGAAVLQGAISTFLAVAVLLFSSSYVFEVLSRQFALTVVLGVLHGLVLLPVMLTMLGPKPYSTAEAIESEEGAQKPVEKLSDNLGTTGHAESEESGSESTSDKKKVDEAVELEFDN